MTSLYLATIVIPYGTNENPDKVIQVSEDRQSLQEWVEDFVVILAKNYPPHLKYHWEQSPGKSYYCPEELTDGTEWGTYAWGHLSPLPLDTSTSV